MNACPDPHCPCHDGDACHYQAAHDTPAWPVRTCATCQRQLPTSHYHVRSYTVGRQPRLNQHCRDCARTARRHRHRDDRPDEEHLLPIQPFSQWLNAYMARHHFTDDQFAAMLGVPARTVFAWRHAERATIRLDSADHAFCKTGQPWQLRDLYPELYDTCGAE